MLVNRSHALLALLSAGVVLGAVGCLEGLGGLTGGDDGKSADGRSGDAGGNGSSAASDVVTSSDGTGGQEGSFEGGPPPPRDSGSDSSSWSPLCPDTQPSTSASCTDPALQCEYGNATWSVSCDAVVQCDDAGTWEGYEPSSEPCS